jgi:hypothetical protein
MTMRCHDDLNRFRVRAEQTISGTPLAPGLAQVQKLQEID